jgi:hypothetical protein
MNKLLLSRLERRTLEPISRGFQENERVSFEKSFLRHVKCANVLFNEKLYRESYLSYLLSVECLLKDLYCFARVAIYGHDIDRSPAGLLLRTKKKNKEENMESFYFPKNLVMTL